MFRRIQAPFATVVFCALAGIAPGAIAYFGGTPLGVAILAGIAGTGLAVAAVQNATGTSNWR
jgi:hypothetical protein